jgi:peptidoglycan/xylan/chitin deacetylase (PgdA/CDA1 family)
MLKTCFDTAIIIPISIAIILFLLLSALAQDYVQFALANQTTTVIKNQLNNNSIPTSSSSTTNTNEVVILNFYDDDISQFTNAKPILDKYGFKVTFFIVCNWANSDNRSRMTWQEINQLYREGHDIESHSMTHKRLNKLSENALDYEVGQSKQCIHDHIGVMPTVFLLHTA